MAAEPAQIDPISRALGSLEGRFDEFQKHMDARFQHVDTRFEHVDSQFALVFRLIGGIYALMIVGFAGLAWLSTHH